MAISEEKMRMVIKNYFNTECDINTTIKEAFEKGFRIGVQKGISAQPERKKGKWIRSNYLVGDMLLDSNEYYLCSLCGQKMRHKHNYCPYCGAEMEKTDG